VRNPSNENQEAGQPGKQLKNTKAEASLALKFSIDFSTSLEVISKNLG
jgi:hypothetical protein